MSSFYRTECLRCQHGASVLIQHFRLSACQGLLHAVLSFPYLCLFISKINGSASAVWAVAPCLCISSGLHAGAQSSAASSCLNIPLAGPIGITVSASGWVESPTWAFSDPHSISFLSGNFSGCLLLPEPILLILWAHVAHCSPAVGSRPSLEQALQGLGFLPYPPSTFRPISSVHHKNAVVSHGKDFFLKHFCSLMQFLKMVLI